MGFAAETVVRKVTRLSDGLCRDSWYTWHSNCTTPQSLHGTTVFALHHTLCIAPQCLHYSAVLHSLCTAQQYLHCTPVSALHHSICTTTQTLHCTTFSAPHNSIYTVPLSLHCTTYSLETTSLLTAPQSFDYHKLVAVSHLALLTPMRQFYAHEFVSATPRGSLLAISALYTNRDDPVIC